MAMTLESWLKDFASAAMAPSYREIGTPATADMTTALAALAAEALARERSLWIVTADDAWLPELSNALDLRLRPLCLVLPGAEYAGRIALRATLSLLKSRLARAGDDSAGPAWNAMRSRLSASDALWREMQAWNARGLDREAPPAGIMGLFPVLIAPWTIAARHATPTDWVMLVQADRLPAEHRGPWPGARHTRLLGGIFHGSTDLALPDTIARLRAEIEVLGQELAEMELELATAEGELSAFTEHYHAVIAWRMAELDRLQAELACWRMHQNPADPSLADAAQTAEARARQSRQDSARFKAEREPDMPRFAPSTDLKKRYRQLAQKIHPDRARDESDRAWRTQLMSEANRAYRAGDATALEAVIVLWQRGNTNAGMGDAVPPATEGSPRGTPTLQDEDALAEQARRIRMRLAAIAAELDRLYGSKLYELFSATRLAARQGRDLLDEMARRLDLQITAAQAELDQADAA